VTEYSST